VNPRHLAALSLFSALRPRWAALQVAALAGRTAAAHRRLNSFKSCGWRPDRATPGGTRTGGGRVVLPGPSRKFSISGKAWEEAFWKTDDGGNGTWESPSSIHSRLHRLGAIAVAAVRFET